MLPGTSLYYVVLSGYRQTDLPKIDQSNDVDFDFPNFGFRSLYVLGARPNLVVILLQEGNVCLIPSRNRQKSLAFSVQSPYIIGSMQKCLIPSKGTENGSTNIRATSCIDPASNNGFGCRNRGYRARSAIQPPPYYHPSDLQESRGTTDACGLARHPD